MRSRSASHNFAPSTECARVPPAGRRAVDARAPTGQYTGRTSPRAYRCRTSRRTITISTVRARGCCVRTQCVGRSKFVELHSPMSTREWLNDRYCSVPPASRRSFGLAFFRTDTREVCPSRSCGTHWTRMVTLHVRLWIYTSRRSPAFSRTRIARTT